MMQSVSNEQNGLRELQRNWGWCVGLGILLMVAGTIAIGRAYFFTTVSMVFFAWLMIVAGIAQAVHACWKERGWAGFFVDLLMGLLYIVVGFMIVANPQSTAITLTLLIAMFLVFEGLFRMVSAIVAGLPHRGWMLLSGAVSLALGLMIWRQWPLSGIWVIGLFVGIQMVLNGWSLAMLGLLARNAPLAGQTSPAST